MFQSCPVGQPSFREKQCAAYNGRKFNRKELPANPQYVPHYSDGMCSKVTVLAICVFFCILLQLGEKSKQF